MSTDIQQILFACSEGAASNDEHGTLDYDVKLLIDYYVISTDHGLGYLT